VAELAPDLTVFDTGHVVAVETTRIARDNWTHEAHIAYAAWVLLLHGPEGALDRIRIAIHRLNESFGNRNTDNAGYHETITAFYVRALDATIDAERARHPAATDLESAMHCVEAFRDRTIPYRYWSKERLLSREARAAWLRPDVASLPPSW
jgi:hypothetical protein